MSATKSRLKTGCLLILALGFLMTLGGGAGFLWVTSYETLVSRPDDPPGRLVIHDTTVVDVVSGSLREHVDVHIDGETIEAIEPTAPPKSDAAVIDGKGKFVVPGLIDMHSHVAISPAPAWAPELPIIERNFEQYLFAGVTRVLDTGGPSPQIFETRAAIAEGEMLGPTLHAAGPIFTAVDGHPIPMSKPGLPDVIEPTVFDATTRQIGSEEDARRAVSELAPLKPDFIKVVVDMIPDDTPRLTPALSAAVVDAATSNDLRAVAHIGSTRDAIIAGDAGVSAWIHGVYREEIPQESIGTLADFGIPMVPTLVVFKAAAELGRERSSTPLERQMAGPDFLRAYEEIPDDHQVSADFEEWISLVRRQREAGLRNVERLHEAGVTILAGSDQQSGLVPGASLHRELALLQEAGLPPIEVLRAATLYAARFLADRDDPAFGVVAPGKQADLVIVDANPLEDSAALSQIDSVVLRGVRLNRFPLAP